jgi:hypothetical protein
MVDIVTLEEVKNRMSLPLADTDIDAALDSAISSATMLLQSILDTPFAYASNQTDLFLLVDGTFPVVPNGRFRLRLKRGFVHTGTLSMVAGYLASELTESIPAADFSVDLEKGIAYISIDHVGKYVSCVYTAGLDVTHPAPDWLKEVVMGYVPTVMNAVQATNRSDEIETVVARAEELVSIVVAPYMRGKAFQYRPLY